jgi:glycerol-3-phosphate dehydrogenase (NAD(P)+)
VSTVAFLGDGAWGTALALGLHRAGHAVTVWGAFPAYVAAVRRTRENKRFLPGVRIPRGVDWLADPAAAVHGADLAIVSTPTQYIRPVLARFAPHLPRPLPLVTVAKGIERGTLLRPSRVIADALPGRRPVAVLCGPSHAEEVARGVPTALTAACRNAAFAARVQSVFGSKRLRVYTNRDVVGVELGAALKNIIAIAAGISDGLGFGDNTKAALVTRGLAEITRLGRALGARRATFDGLSGLGDLMATCASRHSRNRWCGEQVGRGRAPKAVLASTRQVVEGVPTAQAALRLAARYKVEMPITREVCRVLFRGKSPARAVADLMLRRARSES